MPRYCASLTWLFAELDLMERFAAAKEAGFDAVEILSPYDVPVQEVVSLLARYDLSMVSIDCPPPNYTGGSRGFAAVKDLEVRFRQDFKRTLRYARAMATEIIHINVGNAAGAEARALLIENLRWAAEEAPQQKLTIEAMNNTDTPGYFLNDVYQACDIIRDVGAPKLGLQFDAYHVGKIHGDVLKVWHDCHDLVSHVQVAQLPHRSEPIYGKIDYPAFFKALDGDGYSGWVSGEYTPSGTTLGGLDWMR